MASLETRAISKRKFSILLTNKDNHLAKPKLILPNELMRWWHYLKRGIPEDVAPTSSIVPRFNLLLEKLGTIQARLKAPAPADVEGVRTLNSKHLPRFVYYSNYGNLDFGNISPSRGGKSKAGGPRRLARCGCFSASSGSNPKKCLSWGGILRRQITADTCGDCHDSNEKT